jgi:hypothetical protein
VLILCVTAVMAQMNFDFQVPKRYSHRVTTSPPTLYASTVDAEVEGSGLPDVVTSNQFTTSKKILATLGDMSAYFTTARPTNMRIVTTTDWKQKMYSYGQYAKEIRQRRNQMFTLSRRLARWLLLQALKILLSRVTLSTAASPQSCLQMAAFLSG